MLKILAISLALTLVLEWLFALLWGLRQGRELALVGLVNVLTNPPVVLLYHTCAALWPQSRLLAALVLECGAVAVEWLCYRDCSREIYRPLAFSLLANGFSCLTGFLLNLLW